MYAPYEVPHYNYSNNNNNNNNRWLSLGGEIVALLHGKQDMQGSRPGPGKHILLKLQL